MYESWLDTLPPTLDETDKTEIQILFDWIVDPALNKIRKNLKEISPTVN